MSQRRASRKQIEFVRKLANTVGPYESVRISRATLHDPAGKPINVFQATKAPGSSSLKPSHEILDGISGDEASKLIEALKKAAPARGDRGGYEPPEGMRRLQRRAAVLGIGLSPWGKTGWEFTYSHDTYMRFKPQGKGTFYIESFQDGQPMAQCVVQADRIERYWIAIARRRNAE